MQVYGTGPNRELAKENIDPLSKSCPSAVAAKQIDDFRYYAMSALIDAAKLNKLDARILARALSRLSIRTIKQSAGADASTTRPLIICLLVDIQFHGQ